ncbi:choline dehydrogenase [Colletotrichum karsti]|uniref:Choline dehydrogenase n=1 Tax=Colletotrichum karsti TaxID=1095194 RepID=A0A9P6IA80_9PEZI|nr:choline dehydrogenase [Colletotrichum karsti]KAF9878814.1 choline dehydrogenase [Colletotrichum karsti]
MPLDKVLVIEAGTLDMSEAAVMIPRFYPGAAGFAPGTRYDWNLTSVPQEYLQGQTVNLTQGHAIGGSSTSESFTPSPPDHASLYGLTYDPACHGFDGPVHSSYLAWSHPNNTNFLDAMHGLGISSPVDQGCNPLGAYLTTHSIDPRNQSRSSARTAHYDFISKRANLQFAVGHQVTKIILETVGESVVAKGVEFVTGPDAPVERVMAAKEVILSAGALSSPKTLQLSGVGPASLLSRVGIDVSVDLPGVGANLQDHPFGLTLASLSQGIPGNSDLENSTFDSEQRDLYYAERKGMSTSYEGRWTDTIAEALAFIPLHNFTTADKASTILSAINSNSTQYLPQGTDSTVVAGYEKQTEQIISMHKMNKTAAMELLYVDGGRSVVNILMHPMSRGTVSIASSNPFEQPVIDPRYFSHPYDGSVLVESLRFNRELLAAGPVKALGATETLPGIGVQSDDEILNFIKGVTSTEYHYSGTCSMLPKDLGGVVDSELRVHGVIGLRVVDASIMPLLPSAHTQATVYAIAEKAADMIMRNH